MSKNFKKTIQNLSVEQQREYLTLHENQDTILNLSSFSSRTTLKLSIHLSEEEIRNAIAQATGRPIEEIPAINFQQETMKVKTHSQDVESIIKDYKSFLLKSKSPKDKYEELYDIGRFIQASGLKLTISVPSKPSDYPDFDLFLEEKLIGVEHTRLLDQEIIAATKAAKYYIKKAETILKPDFDSLSKTVNIFINYNSPVIGNSNFAVRDFTKEERKEIPHLIANYIKSVLLGEHTQTPIFIEDVVTTNNMDNRLDLELAERFFTSKLFFDLLLERMASKELKSNNYRNEKTLDQLWLLVVTDDLESFSGFDLKDSKFPKLVHSNFDKIFLFEKFGGTIYTLT